MAEIVVPAKRSELDHVICFINEHLAEVECSSYDQAALDIAVEEIFVNIANYAYESDKEGDATIRAVLMKEPPQILIQFIDSGTPYNPLERETPDVELSAEEREIGGLGIFLVKESMDSVTYEYKDNKNILTIEKKL